MAGFLPSARLVFFDPAGTGASDPGPHEGVAELARGRVGELRHVLEATQARRAALVDSLDGGPAALRFAEGRSLAAHIPGARLLALDGARGCSGRTPKRSRP